MSERNDLIDICGMLDISTTNDNKTDIELLRSIVFKLNSKSETESDNNAKLLALNTLPDSLAFPETARELHNLAEATHVWSQLRQFNDSLKQDYTCRRQMLLNRLDCTIESFKWKGSNSSKKDDEALSQDCNSGQHNSKKHSQSKRSLNERIHEKYDKARICLKEEPNVGMSNLLAVRETECDKLLNSVVSSRSLDCKVAYKQQQQQQQQQQANELINLKQIIIPDVPDRGGRPGEVRAPPKESFSQQRRARGGGGFGVGGNRGGGGGRSCGGGRGGRH